MPTNLAESTLAALKVGNDNVAAVYTGNSQIFPNDVIITYWTGQEGRTYTNAAGSFTTTITGPAGSTFNLVGTNGIVTQNALVKSVDGAETFNYSIAANVACDSPQRRASLQLVPTGNTTLNLDTANGSFPATDQGQNTSPVTIPASPNQSMQAASPYFLMTINVAGGAGSGWNVSIIQKNTVTVGGQLRFASGTILEFQYNTGTVTTTPAIAPMNAFGAGAYNFEVLPIAASGFSAEYSNQTTSMGSVTNPTGVNNLMYLGAFNTSLTNQQNKTFTFRYTITDSSGFQPASISYNSFFLTTGLSTQTNNGCWQTVPSNGGIQYLYP